MDDPLVCEQQHTINTEHETSTITSDTENFETPDNANLNDINSRKQVEDNRRSTVSDNADSAEEVDSGVSSRKSDGEHDSSHGNAIDECAENDLTEADQVANGAPSLSPDSIEVMDISPTESTSGENHDEVKHDSKNTKVGQASDVVLVQKEQIVYDDTSEALEHDSVKSVTVSSRPLKTVTQKGEILKRKSPSPPKRYPGKVIGSVQIAEYERSPRRYNARPLPMHKMIGEMLDEQVRSTSGSPCSSEGESIARNVAGDYYVGARLAYAPSSDSVNSFAVRSDISDISNDRVLDDDKVMSARVSSKHASGEKQTLNLTNYNRESVHSREGSRSEVERKSTDLAESEDDDVPDCDADSMDVESEILADNEVSAITGVKTGTAMPCLEDGLSSGHVSESDDEIDNGPPPESLTMLLMRQQINEIEREVAEKLSLEEQRSSSERQSSTEPQMYQADYVQQSYPQLPGSQPYGYPDSHNHAFTTAHYPQEQSGQHYLHGRSPQGYHQQYIRGDMIYHGTSPYGQHPYADSPQYSPQRLHYSPQRVYSPQNVQYHSGPGYSPQQVQYSLAQVQYNPQQVQYNVRQPSPQHAAGHMGGHPTGMVTTTQYKVLPETNIRDVEIHDVEDLDPLRIADDDHDDGGMTERRQSVELAINDIKSAIQKSKSAQLKSPPMEVPRSPEKPVWVLRYGNELDAIRDTYVQKIRRDEEVRRRGGSGSRHQDAANMRGNHDDERECRDEEEDDDSDDEDVSRQHHNHHSDDDIQVDSCHEQTVAVKPPTAPLRDSGTDTETDKLLGKKREYYDDRDEAKPPRAEKIDCPHPRTKEGEEESLYTHNPEVLIEGVLFRAHYLGSTQLFCRGPQSKATRMMQAQEAVSRIKAPDGENQPSTEVDLFISTEKIMVLNTDLQEIMMDHALRTISYIADIGDIIVVMARRRVVTDDKSGKVVVGQQAKMICHVFETEEAPLIAQSIGQAFQVAYVEFLKANGIEDPNILREMDYQEVLNSQEIPGDELNMFASKEQQKEIITPKLKGEILGVVIVESGWGSMLPTVVIANMAPNGAAARCGQLNIGDQIISVNGVSLVGLPLSTCQNYIKACKNQTVVKLTVVSCAPVVEVKIKRPDTKYQLGFSVQNGTICSLLRGGIAERGGVRVGHRIIEINGNSVVAVPHDRIVNLLATSIGEIHMKTMPTSMFRLLTGQETPLYL